MADDISCQVSVYTGCVQVSGGTVTVSESRLEFPAGKKIHGSVYSLASGSQAQFTRDTVRGYGREGKVTGAATVHVAGGEWVPAG